MSAVLTSICFPPSLLPFAFRRAETLSWRVLKESQHAPAGVADLTLTAVGEHGVVAFGGLGSKRASSQAHHLQPATGIWSAFSATGVSFQFVYHL